MTVFAGAALWGLHMGLTQGLLAALVAGSAPADLRGTAFGVFNLVCGIALLVASVLAGWLWDAFGPAFTFYAGAALTAIAWVGLRRYGTAGRASRRSLTAYRDAAVQPADALRLARRRGRRKECGARPTKRHRPLGVAPCRLRCRTPAGDRLPLLPPRAAGAPHALDQRRGADDPADERTADLQCASGAVLGQVVVHRRAAGAGDAGACKRDDGELVGVTRVLGREFDTTGLFGASKDRSGQLVARGFPWWATIPDNQWLSMARSWHFFFAWVFVINGLAYVLYSLGSRHLARDLAPDARRLARHRPVDRSITCASAIRRARRRSATTCCRSSPTSR